MTPFQKYSRIGKTLRNGAFALSISCAVGLYSCNNVEYISEETLTPTKGIITEVEEVEKDRFLIADETVVEEKEDSRIIASYLNGERDTFTLEEARMMAADSTGTTRRSSIGRMAMYGMMGYYLGRSMSSPTRASAYKSAAVHSRVNNQAGSTLRNTANRTTTRRPVKSKSGYGSGKSTRSYGG